MTSYNHLPPPLDNVAQRSNTFSANRDDFSDNVSKGERINKHTAHNDYVTPTSKDISAKSNTSTKPNTSTKSNMSSQDESSSIEENQFQDDSEAFQKPDTTIDHIINPNIEGECIQQSFVDNSPNQENVSYNQPPSPSTLIDLSIDQKIEGLKKEFDTVQ